MEAKFEPLLTPVSDKSEIKEAQNRIERSWKALAKQYSDVKLGIKHGNEIFDCYYIEPLNAWAAFDLAPNRKNPNRFWNAFGLGKLSTDIICEINFSFQGKRTVAGLFAKDTNSNYYILHSGRLGGNYNQEIFWDKYAREICYVSTKKEKSRYAFVSRLDSDLLIENIVEFIREVKRIKYDVVT